MIKNEDNPWKPGDLVQVKSGGLPMTVASIEMGMVICEWFDKDHKQASGVWSPSVLEKYEKPTGF